MSSKNDMLPEFSTTGGEGHDDMTDGEITDGDDDRDRTGLNAGNESATSTDGDLNEDDGRGPEADETVVKGREVDRGNESGLLGDSVFDISRRSLCRDRTREEEDDEVTVDEPSALEASQPDETIASGTSRGVSNGSYGRNLPGGPGGDMNNGSMTDPTFGPPRSSRRSQSVDKSPQAGPASDAAKGRIRPVIDLVDLTKFTSETLKTQLQGLIADIKTETAKAEPAQIQFRNTVEQSIRQMLQGVNQVGVLKHKHKIFMSMDGLNSHFPPSLTRPFYDHPTRFRASSGS